MTLQEVVPLSLGYTFILYYPWGYIDSIGGDGSAGCEDNIPASKKDAVLAAAKAEIIANYEEMNNCYRMLYGLPPIGYTDVYTDWVPPDGIIMDLSMPVHEMTPDALRILDGYGVMDYTIYHT